MARVDISKLMKRADEALNRRNYGLAIFNYIQALSLQPENIDARGKLRATQTRAVNEAGKGNLAKGTFLYLKALILNTIGKHEQAMIACEHSLTCGPDSVRVMALLARSAERQELLEVAAWQRQEIADKYEQEDIDNLWELGELYESMGRGADAVRCYETIAEIDPDEDIGPAIRNASALMTSDTFATAVEKGSHEIIKDRDEAEFLELDAGKLKTDEQRGRAIKYLLENEVQARPDDHRIYIRLGDICYDLDDWAKGYVEAKKHYLKAQEMNATDSSVRDKLGDLEIKKIRVDLRELQAKVKATPKDKALRKKYNEQNKARIAFEVKEFQRRVKDQPLKAIFHYRLGELYFQTKNFDGAISELQQAGKDPKFKIAALTTLGRSFHAMEQYDMAIGQFEEAMKGQELFEKIRDPLYFEAQTHEAKGDLESIKIALAKYTQIYQTDINYKDVKAKVPELQKKVKEAGG